MLTRRQKEVIFNSVREKIPEFSLVKSEKIELRKYFKEKAYDVLTKDEEKFIELAPYEIIRWQPEIHIGGYYGECTFDDDIPKLKNEGYSNNYSVSGFNYFWNGSLGIESKIVDKIPFLANNLKELKENHPKIYEGVKTRLISIINNRNSYVKILDILDHVLSAKDMTLTILKKNYIELYKILKNA